MLEISPVLSGTYDAPDYVTATRNFNHAPAQNMTDASALGSTSSAAPSVASTSDTQNIDPRRYTKFDRTAIDAGTTSMSFGDFLDMVNPLQHIPVLSSIYREAEGETINPVSRVAGDLLYGGAFGVASALIGGIGAVGNSMVESQTGSDVTGNVVASLFGSDKTSTTQLADASDPTTSAATTAAASAASGTAAPNLLPSGTTPVVSATLASAVKPLNSTGLPQSTANAIPLTNNKLPYGGVMDMSNNIQAQNTAIALSESSHAMRLGNTIYTGRLMNGPHPLSLAPTSSTAATSTSGTTTSTAANIVAPLSGTTGSSSSSTQAQTASAQTTLAQTAAPSGNTGATIQASVADSNGSSTKNPIPDALIDDAVILKALNQYKGVATAPAAVGSKLDITN